MAYKPEPPPDKENLAKTGDSSDGLSSPKNTGYSGYRAAAVDQIVDERTIAVLIDSAVLGAPIWFALREGWTPGPDDEKAPVFYASELPYLRSKTPEQLRSIFNVKTGFGGGMVRQ